MRFRILGPVQVRVGRDWRSIRAGQPRLVLAILLAESGRIVPTERLVDAVWGDRPPRTAVNTVHAYVLRLRRLLGDGPLVTQDHGYRLAVGRDDVDAEVFERLVAVGRREIRAGYTESATRRLFNALALWRGPVFADVADSPVLSARAAELDRRRAAANEDWIRARLDLGGHADVVDELYRLVEDQPLREQRWALLMEALALCGRRTESLYAYHQARRVLRDEFGLEPGPELRELQRRILAESA